MLIKLTPWEWGKIAAIGILAAVGLGCFVFLAFLLDGKP